MVTNPPLPEPLPKHLQLALVLLRDGHADDFWPGVARLCQQHPERTTDIHREAERMLAAAEGKGAAGSTEAKPAARDEDAELKQGDRVGPFTVLEEVGHGGMGDVYLAEQREPVRRRVALKVIRLGLDTKAMLARFEAERQALAMMDHSHIAKVFEAGATPTGRPYFAMEFVKGVPITRYCDENKLSLEDRLALFKQVCSGVQHAHQKGVIHRDLTPNNVLVTVQDGKPSAKIIDFGLARATDQRLTEKTLFTQRGMILGTPEYMSPEQAGLNALDIDMRSDVYTLGVLLYELLTGKLPFEPKTLRAQGYDAMCKTIREADPPRPSTKVTTHQGGTDGAAKLRRTDASTLLKRLRGDLDWIVLKCLEKDRTRRYETVSALADDVERYLGSEPVLARAPSASYRLAKFARRYRGQLIAMAAVFVALVRGLGLAVYFWRDAVAQAGAAETARAGEAAKAKEAADNAAIADRNAEAAARNAEAATRNAEAATRSANEAEASAKELAAKVAEFNQLAGVPRLQRLREELEELAVPWRDLIAAQGWLAQADRVLALRPSLDKTLADLRERALPVTPEELARDRATHPRREEHDALRARLVETERAAAMQGGEVLTLPTLTPEEEALTPNALNSLAWAIVDPAEYHVDKQGAMPRALALAKHGWAKSEATGTKDANLADTLAWAWFWNGRDAEALRQSEDALALAPETNRATFEANLADLRRRIAAGEGKAAARKLADTATRLRAELASLELAPSERRTYRFEAEAHGFLHDTLTGLLAKLATFERTERADIAQRLRCAELTASHPNSRATWQQAREAIVRADGVVASELYREHPIWLRPQPGLVPIGMNPVTKLWEFYELRSAWDPATVPDPAALEIPVHDTEGKIAVGADTGIVFVLLPGGTFTMGAQKWSKDKPNYDPDASSGERVHPQTVWPFFLARHELTQGQWRQLGGKRDQRLHTTGETYPIADVDWFTSDALLRARGLSLPTEAQWEYGCRATTTTPWWTGADAASLGDELKDLRPVGTGRSNAFGLFEVHGNVWEWCEDLYDSSSGRAFRGGRFDHHPQYARSAYSFGLAPSGRRSYLGARPARALQP